MQTKRLALLTAVLALTTAALPAAAQEPPARTWTHEHLWKAHGTWECEKKGTEFRCGFDNQRVPTSTIAVKNTTTHLVQFRYEEWHSVCQFNGGKVVSNLFTLQPGETMVLDLLDAGLDSGGGRITCRESFIKSCKKPEGGTYKDVSCTSVVTARATRWEGDLQP